MSTMSARRTCTRLVRVRARVRGRGRSRVRGRGRGRGSVQATGQSRWVIVESVADRGGSCWIKVDRGGPW